MITTTKHRGASGSSRRSTRARARARALVLGVGVALILPSLAHAFEFPQTRPGEVARAYIESFNTGELASMAAFARGFRAQAGLAERSPEERAKRTMNLYDQVGRLVPAAVTAEAAHSITLTVHAEKVDMWLSCAFELEEQEPHGLTQVKIMPASAPSMSANREELDWDALKWQSLADLLEQVRTHANIPALAVAIVEGGQVIDHAVVGVREAGTDVAAQVDDLFHIGSIGKSMTATLLGRLVELEALRWDTTISNIVRDIPMLEVYRDATLAELVQHRAGLPGFQTFTDEEEARLNGVEGSTTEQRAAFLREVLMTEPVGPRGVMAYSNAGYVVAAYMAEVVTQRSWEALLQEHVLERMQLAHTGFGMPATRARPQQPRGHLPSGDVYAAAPLDDGYPLDAFIAPAGNIHASIGDLARYAAQHLEGMHGRDGAVKAETFAWLHALPEGSSDGDGYAAGWMIRASEHGVVHAHGGSAGTFFATVALYPEQRRGVVVAMNIGPQGMMLAEELIDALMRNAGRAAR